MYVKRPPQFCSSITSLSSFTVRLVFVGTMAILGALADLPIYNYLIITVVLGVVVYTASKRSRPNLDHIPGIAFRDGDNSTERYVKDSGTLLHEGYLKV